MTLLPIESRLAVDRPDLPEYELNNACPVTGEVSGLENHHIWRRSAGYPSWWVELPDGEVVGNRIRLSSQAHYRVTVNKARIAYANTVYYWEEDGERTPLRWQPPTMHRGKPQDALERLAERVDGLIGMPTVPSRDGHHPTMDEEAAEWLNAPMGPYIEPGHDCPTCKRRVPLPKKATSPSTKVFSCRIPIDDVETFSEIVDAAAEHARLKSKPHHVYNALLVGLTLVLQAPREDLPDVG